MSAHWPCLNRCERWCRSVDPRAPMTNHHPRCEHVDASLMDVWRVSYDGASYVTDTLPTREHEHETVTREKMHREIYEQLGEFVGF